jgi:hypothetical protein
MSHRLAPALVVTLASFALCQQASGETPSPPATGTMADCPLHATHAAAAAAAARVTSEHATALAARGEQHMGFSQEATTHHFLLLADGGAVEVTANDPLDAATVAQVRDHLRHLAGAFAAGDFSIPHAVHAQEPPGTEAMRAAGHAIAYSFVELPAGGSLRLTASTPQALAAAHEFLRFQIEDHATGDPTAAP